MNPFESRIRSRIESEPQDATVDALLEEFPEELRERLEREIGGMDDQSAEDYLINKLIARKESLVVWGVDDLPKAIEISHDVPLAVLKSIESTVQNEDESLLGEGKNGKVYQSIRREYACYKVLFLEKVRQLQINVMKEATFQYTMGTLLRDHTNSVRIPEVLGFVDHPQVQAVLMEKVEGSSLFDILTNKAQLPENFDIESFFEKLESGVRILNENGYFHRDLNNNAGNVMVGKDGTPWIIDFGSSIRAVNHDGNANAYQLYMGGVYMLSTDLSGVQKLKQRLIDHLKQQGK